MAKLVLLVLAVFLYRTVSTQECCPANTRILLQNRSCSDNSSIKLQCEKGYYTIILDELPEDYDILKNDTMVDTSDPDKPVIVDYCTAMQEDSKDLFLLCFLIPAPSFREKTLHLQAILTCISAVFVILTMIVYFLVPSLLDLQGKCTMQVLAGLACSYIFLAIVQLNSINDDVACKSMAYLIYISFVYMFTWLTILSFHIWRTTVKPQAWTTVSWLVVYHVVGIGGTLAVLLVILLAHYHPSEVWDNIRPGFGETSCWFESRRQIWIYFYGPFSVLLAINVVFYLWTLVVLWRSVERNRNRSKILKYRFKLCVRLCIIMGITWSFEVITFAINIDETGSNLGNILVFILDLINVFEGILIFLVLVVFRKSVRRGLANRNICMVRFPSSWRYLEDEEMESEEEKANGTTIHYTNGGDPREAEQLNS